MKKNILILHGWGLQGSKYNDLKDLFPADKYTVYAIDLPGFGKEVLNNENMHLSDYVEFVYTFLTTKHIKSVILVGHSFGGRVGLKFAYTYPDMVEKMILTGTPIIRHFSFRQRIGSIIAAVGKKGISFFPQEAENIFRKFLYRLIGEYDYYKAGNLKKVLTNIVNEDLQEYAKSISCPVLLVWGEKDTFTPATDVKEILQLIPNGRGIVVSGTTHGLPYKNAELFYKEIKDFI